jgi:uncharacterized CHY-type Zn-finger protein
MALNVSSCGCWWSGAACVSCLSRHARENPGQNYKTVWWIISGCSKEGLVLVNVLNLVLLCNHCFRSFAYVIRSSGGNHFIKIKSAGPNFLCPLILLAKLVESRMGEGGATGDWRCSKMPMLRNSSMRGHRDARTNLTILE